MVLELNNPDHKMLNEYLDELLDAYKNGNVDRVKARSEIAQVIAAAAQDKPGTIQQVRAFRDKRREEA